MWRPPESKLPAPQPEEAAQSRSRRSMARRAVVLARSAADRQVHQAPIVRGFRPIPHRSRAASSSAPPTRTAPLSPAKFSSSPPRHDVAGLLRISGEQGLHPHETRCLPPYRYPRLVRRRQRSAPGSPAKRLEHQAQQPRPLMPAPWLFVGTGTTASDAVVSPLSGRAVVGQPHPPALPQRDGCGRTSLKSPCPPTSSATPTGAFKPAQR